MHLYISYLDAGTGSVVFQSLVGIVAGVGVFGRKFIGNLNHKVRNLFSKTDSVKHSDKS